MPEVSSMAATASGSRSLSVTVAVTTMPKFFGCFGVAFNYVDKPLVSKPWPSDTTR